MTARIQITVAALLMLTSAVASCAQGPTSSLTADEPASPARAILWTVDDLGVPAELADIALGDGNLVAVGYRHWEEPAISGALLSEDGGQTWQAAADAGLDTGAMTAVTHGPVGFVAVGRPGGAGPGRTASIWASADGRGWQAIIDPPSAGAGLSAVVASDDRYVAGGIDGAAPAVFVSVDGVRWQESPTLYGPAEYEAESASLTGDWISALATHDGRFMAALGGGAHRGEIWASDDGRAWALIGSIDSVYGISGLTWDDNGLLAIGSDSTTARPRGRIWASPDGIAWEVVAQLGLGDGLDLDAGPSGYVATSMSEAGLPGIWTSADGMSWAQEATPEAGTPSPIARSIISVDGGFVGVGSRGTTVDDATMVVWHGTPAP